MSRRAPRPPVVAGEPGTAALRASATRASRPGYAAFPQTFVAGTAIVLDSASPLYTYLNGRGVLRAFVQGQDDRGGAALAN